MASIQHILQQLTGDDEEDAEGAVLQLSTLDPAGQAEAFEALRQMLASPDAGRRWYTLYALSEIEHPGVPALLAQALGDPIPSVRQCAALALRRHPSVQAIPNLATCLSDSDPLVARLAADALAAAGKPATPTLLDILQNGPHIARLEAVRALATLGDQNSIPALLQALDDESALIEYWAGEGLERMGVGMTFFNPG